MLSRFGFVAVALVVFAQPACASLSISTSSKVSPVTKVINLLQDMMRQMTAEGNADEALYDKQMCWCETNDKDKTESIVAAEVMIGDLTSKIEEFTAKSTQLAIEKRRLEKAVLGNTQAMAEAAAIREKEQTEFGAEEKDLLISIGALKSAVVVLGKHSKAQNSFLQMGTSHTQVVASAVNDAMQKHDSIVKSTLTDSQREVIASFLQLKQPEEAGFMQSSAPYDTKSGEIFGILNQMKESFETQLANSQKEEQESSAAFQQVKVAKQQEIDAAEAQRYSKGQLLAEAEDDLQEKKEDKAVTEDELFSDQQFLASLKNKCKVMEREWEKRKATREEEMQAVSEALATLNTDDAHDLFSKALTAPATFLQLRRKRDSVEDRDTASMLLSNLADEIHSPAVSQLAVRVRLDPFVKVKSTIDEMVAQLTQQSADEVKVRDSCNSQINTNLAQSEKKHRQKKATDQKILELESQITAIGKRLYKLNRDIIFLRASVVKAGNDRNFGHADFTQTIADQRAAQQLLVAAKQILEGFYVKSKAKLINFRQLDAYEEGQQTKQPSQFGEYKQQDTDVLGMIDEIIKDAKKIESDAMTAESDAQSAYEEMVKESNIAIDTKSKALNEQREVKSHKEAALVEEKATNEDQVAEINQLATELQTLHENCDFVLNNFGSRQKARGEEINSLREIRGMLSGAKMLQTGKVRTRAVAPSISN